MAETGQAVRGNLTKVFPSVYVGAAARPLVDTAHVKIDRLVVDSHAHLPDMFEISFHDRDSEVATLSAISIGTPVVIGGHGAGQPNARLIAGEVTAVEAVFAEVNRTVVRGYTKDHRLQRVRRTRTFLNMKDSDIARKIATEAGLIVGTIEQTRATHDHVGQVNQTDWEFLVWRAGLLGFEFGMSGDGFYFRAAPVASGAGAPPVPLSFPHNLRTFRPRITAGNLPKQAEVRGWDPLAAKVVGSAVATAAGSVAVTGTTPGRLAGTFAAPPAPPRPPSTNPAVGNLGPDPSDTAFVVSDWAVAAGPTAAAVHAEAAEVLAEHVGSTFAEADGEASGNPRLMAGQVIDVSGVSTAFAGKWVVTRAQHVFDTSGYHTRFEVSGRHERTILGLTAGRQDSRTVPRIPGLVCGIVTNNNDPLRKGRVKLTLPWLSPAFESDWAPVVQAGAGRRAGALFLPEVGDQVLAGFEFGNPMRPYVIGGVLDNNSRYSLGGEPVKVTGASAAVVWRGIVTGSGNRLAFHDELPPGAAAGPPIASELVLGTGDATMSLAIDQVAGTVALRCQPTPPNSKATAGSLTIDCGPRGTIDVNAGPGGTVNVGGGQLNLSANQSIKIESTGPVEISGHPIKLN